MKKTRIRRLYVADYLITPDHIIQNGAVLCENSKIIAVGGGAPPALRAGGGGGNTAGGRTGCACGRDGDGCDTAGSECYGGAGTGSSG